MQSYRSSNDLNKLEIPFSILQNLISPDLISDLKKQSHDDYASNFCNFQLYTQLFSNKNEIEGLIRKYKAELLKELIGINARKNFIKRFHDNKDYELLVKDAKTYTTVEHEKEINQALHQLEDFISSR